MRAGTREKTESRINDIVASYSAAIPEGGLEMDMRLADDLGIDSIALIGLVISMEESFGISITDDLMIPDHFETVGSLQEMMNRFLEEQEEK